MAAAAPDVRDRPLFGRAEIRERISLSLRAAAGNQGSLLLLEGEEGVGKTTVLRTAVDDARAMGFRALEARAVPSDLPPPLGVVRQLARGVSAESPGAPTAGFEPRSVGGLALLLAPTWDAGSSDRDATNAGLRSPDSGDSDDRLLRVLGAPAQRPEDGDADVYPRLSEFFLRQAETGPLLLAVDDADLADDQSLRFLSEFSRSLVGRPVLVVATHGPAGSRAPHRAAIDDVLPKDAPVERLRIRPLTPPELGEYARWLLQGRPVPTETVQRWFAQTQGNPQFVERIVRKTTFSSARTPPSAEPTDLDEILRHQVQALPSEDRRLLLHAAVLGRDFDFATLHAALAIDDRLALAEALERLVRAGLLQEKDDEVYAFAREAVRAEVYRDLTESLRRVLHRKAARAIAGRAHGADSALYELARQYYLAQDDSRSLEFNQRAAERATSARAFRDATIHYERALESARRLPKRDPAREIRLAVELGQVLGEPLGDLVRAEKILREAVAAARGSSGLERERGLALLFLARNLVNQGLNEEGRALAEEALALFEREGGPREILVAHRTLGLAHLWLSDFGAAETHLRAALALAETEGDRAQQGVVLTELANALITPGPARGEEALALYDRAAELLTPVGDFAALARLRMNQAWILGDSGRPSEAERTIALACDLAERAGSRYWKGWCAMVQALLRTNRGELAGARESLDRALGLLAPLGDRIANQQLAWIEGMIEEKSGRLSAAREKYASALEDARRLGARAEVALMLFRLAHLALAEGATDEARTRLREALDADVESLHAEAGPEIQELRRALGL